MKSSEETLVKLFEAIGNTLIKIGENEYSSEELDKKIGLLVEGIKFLDNSDTEVIKELFKVKDKKEILAKQHLEKLISLLKKKDYKIEKIDDEMVEAKKRLDKHFEGLPIYENKAEEIDTSFEVKIKHLIPDQKLYFEQNKVLLTILTSHICTQDQVDRIKNIIEDGKTFTHSIKKVIKDKTKLSRVKELCRLQDERFMLDEETAKRLYL